MARIPIPLNGPSYKSRQLKLSAQATKNFYPAASDYTRGGYALHSRPGLKHLATPGGNDRGTHIMNETYFSVMGEDLVRVDFDGTVTVIGTVPGVERCVFADDGDEMVIATGGTPYLYVWSTGTLAPISDPNVTKPRSVAILNNQFILDRNGTVFGEFVTSESSATSFAVDALDFAVAETHPDDIVRVFVFGDHVYFFGTRSVEQWYNSGAGNPPFDRVQGGTKRYGIAGTHAITATEDYMYFLDHRRIPRRSTGFQYQSIIEGYEAIGIEFNRYAKISDCVVDYATLDGQTVILFAFPSEDRTWGFHEGTGQWFQWTFGVEDARFRGVGLQYVYGLTLCNDHSNGRVYWLDPCTHRDEVDSVGEVIRRERVTGPIHGGLYEVPGKRLWINKLEIIFGQGDCLAQGLGQGEEPAFQQTELCGALDDLEQGGVLPETSLVLPQSASVATTESLRALGINPSDSKIVSFTAAFVRESAPQVEADVRDGKAYIIDFYDDNSTALRHQFSVFMDTSGHIKVEGRNSAGTIVLDVTITNNGASFADSTAHMIAFIADLESPVRREVWVDALEVQNNASYVTWNTYTDEAISYTDLNVNGDMNVRFGGNSARVADTWGGPDSAADTNGWTTGVDRLGFVSWDNTCSLIPGACWNDDGWVRDPQAWNGWYLTQPYAFFTNSFMRNTGTWGRMVEVQTWASSYELTSDIYNDPEAGMLNAGIGGTV